MTTKRAVFVKKTIAIFEIMQSRYV